MAATILSMSEMVTQLLLIVLYAMYVNVKLKFKLLYLELQVATL